MKTLCGIAVVGLVLLVAAAPRQVAAVDDGNELLMTCKASILKEEAIEMAEVGSYDAWKAFALLPGGASCEGLVDGIFSTERQNAWHPDVAHVRFCPPAAIKNIQARRIIVRSLETHPERLHLSAILLATWALREAFPCPAPAR